MSDLVQLVAGLVLLVLLALWIRYEVRDIKRLAERLRALEPCAPAPSGWTSWPHVYGENGRCRSCGSRPPGAARFAADGVVPLERFPPARDEPGDAS